MTSQTYDEIRNQPTSWAETIGAVDRRWPAIRDGLPFSEAAQALFVGSGTSLYIAQAAAANGVPRLQVTATVAALG